MPSNVWLIADPDAEAGALETLPDTPGLVVLSRNDFVSSELGFRNGERVCINSEAAMDDVVARFDPARKNAIGILKDKRRFREALAALYPDFYFAEVATDDLPGVRLDPSQHYVIKPTLGCFGTAVRTIRGDTDLSELAAEIEAEVAKNAAVLSASVLSSDTVIIEEYVEGEEYALDMFYDSAGRPVITNTYHHPMPANPAYLHMVYYSSPEVYERLYEPAMVFLQKLNTILNISGLPLHCEFRMDGDRLVPIEINSLRFGGMGLANMSHYTCGVNPYEHFIADTAPDWPSVYRESGNLASVFVIAYNGEGVNLTTHEPDWPRFETQFSSIVRKIPFDHQSQLAFGIVYALEKPERIPDLLKLEFADFFVASGSPDPS